MNIDAQLDDLNDLAVKLDIRVETCDLSDNEFSLRSGFCKLRGKSLVILDKKLSAAEKVEIILNTLANFDLEKIYIPSWIRDRLERAPMKEVRT